VMMKLEGDFKPSDKVGTPPEATLADLWILSRLSEAVSLTQSGLESYNFSQATTAPHSFWLYEFCDVYLEMIKPVFNADVKEAVKAACRETLYTCLETGLKLLHPFMPFVTEELYQRLPRRASEQVPSIMVSSFPTDATFGSWRNTKAEEDVQSVQEVVRSIRSIRSNYNVIPSKRPKVYVSARNPDMFKTLGSYQDIIKTLSLSGEVVLQTSTERPAGSAVNIVNDSCDVYVDIRDLIDISAEITRLEGKRAQTNTAREVLLKKTSIADYENKVPTDVRAANSQKLAALEQEIANTTSAIEDFAKMQIK